MAKSSTPPMFGASPNHIITRETKFFVLPQFFNAFFGVPMILSSTSFLDYFSKVSLGLGLQDL